MVNIFKQAYSNTLRSWLILTVLLNQPILTIYSIQIALLVFLLKIIERELII